MANEWRCHSVAIDCHVACGLLALLVLCCCACCVLAMLVMPVTEQCQCLCVLFLWCCVFTVCAVCGWDACYTCNACRSVAVAV